MSEPQPASGHSYTLWLVGILAVLMVYVASWPFVELKYGTHTTSTRRTTKGSVTEHRFAPPPWADKVYHPLHVLERQNNRKNPLSYYFGWCVDKFWR